MSFIKGAGVAIALALLLFLPGCATPVGTVPSLSGPVTDCWIDPMNGTIRETDAKGNTSIRNFDVEARLHEDRLGNRWANPRLFEWLPLFGLTYCAGHLNPFVGSRFFSVAGFGFHTGADRENVVPLGLDYRKAGIVFGASVEEPWEDIMTPNAQALRLGLLVSLPL